MMTKTPATMINSENAERECVYCAIFLWHYADYCYYSVLVRVLFGQMMQFNDIYSLRRVFFREYRTVAPITWQIADARQFHDITRVTGANVVRNALNGAHIFVHHQSG